MGGEEGKRGREEERIERRVEGNAISQLDGWEGRKRRKESDRIAEEEEGEGWR